MALYNDHILPRILNWAMGTSFIAEERKKALVDVSGRVLEVGFGSGHNLPFYSSKVQSVVAIDPSAVSAKLARKRILMASFPVDYMRLEGEKIFAPDGSFDSVVSTFTLCTIPDVTAALRLSIPSTGNGRGIGSAKGLDSYLIEIIRRINPLFLLDDSSMN